MCACVCACGGGGGRSVRRERVVHRLYVHICKSLPCFSMDPSLMNLCLKYLDICVCECITFRSPKSVLRSHNQILALSKFYKIRFLYFYFQNRNLKTVLVYFLKKRHIQIEETSKKKGRKKLQVSLLLDPKLTTTLFSFQLSPKGH